MTGKRRERRPRTLRVHITVFLALLGAVVLIGLVKLWQPVSQGHRQQQEIARLRAEREALRAEQRQLEGYKHDLASDRGQESTLRRQRYVKPGERRLEFVEEGETAKKGKGK
jgi:cell division protein FtsB